VPPGSPFWACSARLEWCTKEFTNGGMQIAAKYSDP